MYPEKTAQHTLLVFPQDATFQQKMPTITESLAYTDCLSTRCNFSTEPANSTKQLSFREVEYLETHAACVGRVGPVRPAAILSAH